MTDQKTLHIFVGPTGHDLPRSWKYPQGCEIHAPVKRGDIGAISALGTQPASILIVDGVFHTYPAVGHVEIRNAIGRGWAVWGTSSMGAIRAAEMATLGMKGFGRVYEMFASEGLDDDEVTLLHEATSPYTGLSEPLVHMRALLHSMNARGLITEVAQDRIVASLKSRWYGYRSLRVLGDLLATVGELAPEVVREELEQMHKYKLKTFDMMRFIEFFCPTALEGSDRD